MKPTSTIGSAARTSTSLDIDGCVTVAAFAKSGLAHPISIPGRLLKAQIVAMPIPAHVRNSTTSTYYGVDSL